MMDTPLVHRTNSNHQLAQQQPPPVVSVLPPPLRHVRTPSWLSISVGSAAPATPQAPQSAPFGTRKWFDDTTRYLLFQVRLLAGCARGFLWRRELGDAPSRAHAAPADSRFNTPGSPSSCSASCGAYNTRCAPRIRRSPSQLSATPALPPNDARTVHPRRPSWLIKVCGLVTFSMLLTPAFVRVAWFYVTSRRGVPSSVLPSPAPRVYPELQVLTRVCTGIHPTTQ